VLTLIETVDQLLHHFSQPPAHRVPKLGLDRLGSCGWGKRCKQRGDQRQHETCHQDASLSEQVDLPPLITSTSISATWSFPGARLQGMKTRGSPLPWWSLIRMLSGS